MSERRFDDDFEEDVIAQCLADREYLKQVARAVPAHAWGSPQRAWLWKKACEALKECGEPLTARLMVAVARRDFPGEEERRPYVEAGLRLFTHAPEAPRAALRELERFSQFAALSSGFEKVAQHIERGDIEKAVEAALAAARVGAARTRGYTRVRWAEEYEARQEARRHRREHPEEYPRVPTGIRRLDEIMGGLAVTELGLVMGTTGKGKSIMLVQFGFAAAARGFNVLHFSLEMPAEQIAQRYDSRFTGVLYSKFKEYDFTNPEVETLSARFEKNLPRFRDKLNILDFPIASCKFDDMEGAIDDVSQSIGKPPDLVIMDSGDHLRSPVHYSDKRHEHTEVYERLCDLASRRRVPVWSSTHAGREWADKTATAEAAAESYDKSRLASCVITLNAPKVEKVRAKVLVDDDDEPGVKRVKPEEGPPKPLATLDVFLAKYRDGRSNKHVQMDAEFERMLIKESSLLPEVS